MHDRGANVALVGLEPEKLHALADRLGPRAAAFEADVTDAAAVQRAVDDTVARFGALDVAVANAGLHFIGSVVDAPIEQLEREIDVNLLGVLRTVRAAAPHVIARQGYLLNVASLAAASHAPLMGAYAASKAGVEALTDALRQELRPGGTRVGCAYFGFIDTDLVRSSMHHASSQAMEGLMPGFVRRHVSVDVAADAIERAVVGRRARVWAPRYVGGALRLRGLVQPLAEQRAMRSRRLPAALEAAAPAPGLAAQDLTLGIAAGPIDEQPLLTTTTPSEDRA
ncbi:SDR family NAD(P)-dependent oxidoreductase [Conexibacter sp. W3-3-2]|nr:SDR family NAD(P)-dependent oxidoreductase [Conexibacter sp. W3-3-2]